MMSTADSQLLVISSSVAEDLYHKTLNKDVTSSKLLFISRIVTLIVGVFGFVIAISSEDLIFKMVSYAWSGLGASFGPAILLLLFWSKITKEGILSGMITGFVVTILWENIPEANNIISVRFVSYVLALLVIIVVSKMTAHRENFPIKK